MAVFEFHTSICGTIGFHSIVRIWYSDDKLNKYLYVVCEPEFVWFVAILPNIAGRVGFDQTLQLQFPLSISDLTLHIAPHLSYMSLVQNHPLAE
jgi:hypothetical protein